MRGIFVLFLACTLLPVEAQSKIRAEKLVTDAKPYVETALTLSMDTLTEKAANKPAAKDFAFLGLAMLAGRRPSDHGQEDQYAQKLENLEARLLPLSDTYIEVHPNIDFRKVDWVDVLKPTSDELLVSAYYEQRYSADYWLGLAMTRRNMPFYANGKIDVLGTGRSTSGGNASPRQGAATVYNSDLVLKREVLMTAAACLRAVRLGAGLQYQGPREMPTIVRLLRKFPYLDVDDALMMDESKSADKKVYIGGTSACGTDAQFQSYVDLLKVSARD